MDATPLLAGLDSDQLAAVTSDAELLRVLAPAGSGKTRVLTRRIAYRAARGSLDAEHTLVLTFTRRAARELDVRLRALGLDRSVVAGTFHAVAWSQLLHWWARRREPPPTLIDDRGRHVTRLARRAGLDSSTARAELDWASARLIRPDHYPDEAANAGRKPRADPEVIAAVFRDYVEEKQRLRLVDFDDLLRLMIRNLTEDEATTSAQRWRFCHFFVDEFQDVNPAQFQLLESWIGPRRDVCVVGDPRQAIYGWNGADASYLEHFADWFPGAETVELNQNYRSSSPIVLAGRAVLGEGARARVSGDDGEPPELWELADPAAEADAAALAIAASRARGRPWSTHAIIVRTNAQIAVLAEALAARQIPHRMRGLRRTQLSESTAALLRSFSAAPTLESIACDLRDPSGPLLETEPAAVDSARSLLSEYRAFEPDGTPAGFVEWASGAGPSSPPDRRDAVTVTTAHAAKGLEWEFVWLAGLEEGYFPISHARDHETMAEERRLLHVAVTRAGAELHMSWAKVRSFGAQTRSRRPSRWLDPVRGAAVEYDRNRQPVAPPVRSADPSPATELRTALREWRRVTARAARVRDGAVLSDHALDQIVRTSPHDTAALAATTGLGTAQLRRHGSAIVRIVSDHVGVSP